MAVIWRDGPWAYSSTFSAVLVFVIACGIFALSRVGRRPADLPPGPGTLPLIGNLHLMPTFKSYIKFAEWGQIYGPIYSLMVGSTPLIMIQSQKVAKELLDKRGMNYSSRPSLHILADVSARGLRQLAMPYSPTWRSIHRLNHQILNAKTVRAFKPYQDLESRQMLVDLLETPGQYKKHIQRYANSVACQMIYGFRTTTFADPKLQTIVSVFFEICDLSLTIPARLMDCYPILKNIPRSLLPVCRRAVELEQQCTKLFLERWHEYKKKALDGSPMPSFVGALARAQQEEHFSDELASYMAGDIVLAGSSTTSDELFGFLMAMVTHPDVQKRAQEEIDSVIGDGRLPNIDDMDSLPYIRGCLRETLRWMPTTALLVPHSPVKDDIYEGHKIPAGATVIVNVWAINMDPERWPNPRKFDPSRFMDEKRSEHEVATSADPLTSRHNFVFGAGRRLCPGIHVAERNLFLTMACLLWAFDFSTPDPSKIDTEDLRGGLAVVPAPFQCHLKSRDVEREKVIRREWTQMQEDFLDPVTKQWVRVPEGIEIQSNSYKKEKI